MTRTKLTITFFLTTILLMTQVIAVGAAPAGQETTPTTTVKSITIETNTETVIVVLEYDAGTTQTISLSFEEATNFSFVIDDGTGKFVVNEALINAQIEFDPVTLTSADGEKEHPVGSALANFFSDTLGVDYETVMTYHEDGVGFGVIAQALWMTNALEGDTAIFSAILEAKQNKDFSAILLPDGSIPENWGQFRKAVMSDRDKSKENLGAIMSGRAENVQGLETQDTLKNNGKSFDKSNNGKSFESLDETNQEKSNNGKAPDKSDNGKDKDKNKDKNKNK